MIVVCKVQPVGKDGRPDGDVKELPLHEAQLLCSQSKAVPVGGSYVKGDGKKRGKDDTQPVATRSASRQVDTVKATDKT